MASFMADATGAGRALVAMLPATMSPSPVQSARTTSIGPKYGPMRSVLARSAEGFSSVIKSGPTQSSAAAKWSAPSLIAFMNSPMDRHRRANICLLIVAANPVSGRPARAMIETKASRIPAQPTLLPSVWIENPS